jgi:hypothetical protein
MRISIDMDGVLADMDAALARLAEQEFGGSARAVAPPPPPPSPSATAGQASATAGQASATAGPAQSMGSADSGGSAESAPPNTPAAPALARLSARQQARLWQRVRDTRNFWETLQECEPGAVQRLQRLAHERRWDVIFVTQRPPSTGQTVQVQTQRWLRRHHFDLPSVYTTQGSRGRIAAALTLDTHIDDRLDNCVDVASDSKAWPILVWRDDETFARIGAGAAKLGIAVVHTVGEALDTIEQADRTMSAQQDQPSLLERFKRSVAGR